MAGIELVIFDLDGTLVDSLPDLADATNHFLAAAGRPMLAPAEVKKLVGQGAKNLVERALQGAPAEEVELSLSMFLAYNEAHIADKTTLYAGVAEMLEGLRSRGKRVALISNKNEALCRKLLGALHIDHYFETVLGADSTPFRKPSPEPVLRVLRDLGVSPEKAVMVGDSINDVAAGRSAGIMTIACTFGYGDPAETAEADFAIDHMEQLLFLPIF